MLILLKDFKEKLLDVLFARQDECLLCNSKMEEKSGLCPSCYGNLHLLEGKQEVDLLSEGTEKEYFYSAAFYNNFLRELYARYKFEGQSFYKKVFSTILLDYIQSNQNLMACQWIAYIPMERRRKLLKGYNPIEEIGRDLAEGLGIPLVHLLVKAKKTKEQNKSSRIERESNMKGAFALNDQEGQVKIEEIKKGTCRISSIDKSLFLPKLGILLDDFITSGNTMLEAQRVLRKEGIQALSLSLALSTYPKDLIQD